MAWNSILAVRHRLNIVAILGNDSAWGIDRQIQIDLYGRPVATELLQTRYEQVVQGLGGYGEFVERAEDLEPALQRAFASNGWRCSTLLFSGRSVLSRSRYRSPKSC